METDDGMVNTMMVVVMAVMMMAIIPQSTNPPLNPVMLSFDFGIPEVTLEIDSLAPAWKIAEVAVDITNPHDSTFARSISCCWSYANDQSVVYSRNWDGGLTEFVLTLNPGETYRLVSPAHYEGVSELNSNTPPYPVQQTRYYYHFKDELGNTSELVLA